jgi:outer membrane lipoprotein-sorting protein
MRFSHFFLPIVCVCAAVTAHAAPSAAEIISQARAKIGPEAKLSAVKSLSFEGKIFDADGKERAFQKVDYKLPDMRRDYSLQAGTSVEIISASNGLEGYAKAGNVNTKNQQIRPFGSQEIKLFTAILQAETGFFAEPPKGKVKYIGEGLQQSKTCYILEYEYAGGLFYRRYFDRDTKLLVAQESYAADTPEGKRRLTVEEGELFVDGIRFPKKVTTYLEGKKVASIEYSSIKINPDIPDSNFAFPMP